jgi:hypothetical protein
MIRVYHNTLHIIQVLSLRRAQQANGDGFDVATASAFFVVPDERPPVAFAAPWHRDFRLPRQ